MLHFCFILVLSGQVQFKCCVKQLSSHSCLVTGKLSVLGAVNFVRDDGVVEVPDCTGACQQLAWWWLGARVATLFASAMLHRCIM